MCVHLAHPNIFSFFPGREVDPGLRAPLGHGPALVVALHHALPDAPAALQRPTTILAPAVALLLVVHHHRPPNRRSLPNAPPRRASPQPHPPLRLLREPPSPVPALVPAPALVLLLLTASAKICIYVLGESTVETSCFSSRISLDELADWSSYVPSCDNETSFSSSKVWVFLSGFFFPSLSSSWYVVRQEQLLSQFFLS